MEHARSSLIRLISSGCLQTERGVSLYKKMQGIRNFLFCLVCWFSEND